MFRAQAMVWVDLLVDRRSVQEALRCLGGQRIIELRPYDREQPPFEVAADEGLRERLARVRERLARYDGYLPAPGPPPAARSRAMQATGDVLPELENAAGAWLEDARPVIQELEASRTRLERYRLLEKCLDALRDEDLDMKYFVRPERGPPLRYVPVIALGRVADQPLFDSATQDARFRARPVTGDSERAVFFGFIDRGGIAELERLGHACGVNFASVPRDLAGGPGDASRQLQSMVEIETRRCDELRSELDHISQTRALPERLWLLHRHLWVQDAMRDALAGVRFVWIGGWVVARRYPRLTRALEESGIPFLVNRDEAGDHGEPPIQLENPGWVRRFEVFARGFGMPSRDEVDPSPLLAVITPLMFGYMFGDVGQGLVVAGIAWMLRARVPVLSLLVPAGLAAAAFGFLFGSVFCSEHLLPALWLHPMEEPMTLLIVPVGFGFLFTLTGMALAGLQSHWAGAAGRWWRREFPLVLMYGAAVLLVWHVPAALALGLAGLGAYVVFLWTSAYRRGGFARAAGHSVGGLLELLEILAQLLINTVSFARLGAFALAHAGLSAAVVTLAAIPDSALGAAVILVAGNILVIALEGLVVAIQTTRLVMFEFFRRFYTGSGREFRPLALPEAPGTGTA